MAEIGGNRWVSRPPAGRLSAMIAMINKAHLQLIAEQRKTALWIGRKTLAHLWTA